MRVVHFMRSSGVDLCYKFKSHLSSTWLISSMGNYASPAVMVFQDPDIFKSRCGISERRTEIAFLVSSVRGTYIDVVISR